MTFMDNVKKAFNQDNSPPKKKVESTYELKLEDICYKFYIEENVSESSYNPKTKILTVIVKNDN